ncbi:MAG: signal peptide peptidase SppA, partial [Opitutus sp.]
LVDELGGLDTAVAHAAEMAGLGPGYRLGEYPRPKALLEAIQELVEKNVPGFIESRGMAGRIAGRIEEELMLLRSFNDPRGIYARLPMNLSIR